MTAGYGGPGEVNWDPLDRWTFGHFGVGAVLGLMRVPWWQALIAAVGWDLLERVLKSKWPGIWPHPSQDTPQHMVVDAAAWMLGWAVTRQYVVGFGTKPVELGLGPQVERKQSCRVTRWEPGLSSSWRPVYRSRLLTRASP